MATAAGQSFFRHQRPPCRVLVCSSLGFVGVAACSSLLAVTAGDGCCYRTFLRCRLRAGLQKDPAKVSSFISAAKGVKYSS